MVSDNGTSVRRDDSLNFLHVTRAWRMSFQFRYPNVMAVISTVNNSMVVVVMEIFPGDGEDGVLFPTS